MSRLGAERLNGELDRLREAGWQEAHYETWIRETALDIAKRALAGAGERTYLMGPEVLGDPRCYPTRASQPLTPDGGAYAQVRISWPRLVAVAVDPTHLALAIEPDLRTIAMRELGAARAAAGLAGT